MLGVRVRSRSSQPLPTDPSAHRHARRSTGAADAPDARPGGRGAGADAGVVRSCRRRRSHGRLHGLHLPAVAVGRRRRRRSRCGSRSRTPTGARSRRWPARSGSTASRCSSPWSSRRGGAGRAVRRRLPAPRGARGRRALRPAAAVGVRRRDDGPGQRPDRAVPRPRDPVDRGLRAGGHAPPAGDVAGGGHQVLRARRVLVGLLPLRHRHDLRRHRHDQPGRDPRHVQRHAP